MPTEMPTLHSFTSNMKTNSRSLWPVQLFFQHVSSTDDDFLSFLMKMNVPYRVQYPVQYDE
jgi:hypothetical protein